MTRILAGVPHTEPTYDQALLDRAKENLERYFCAVGTMESMGDVVSSLGQRLGWKQRSIPTLNVMQQPRSQIDDETRDIIAEHNRLDIERSASG
jgi:hypothetical protein